MLMAGSICWGTEYDFNKTMDNKTIFLILNAAGTADFQTTNFN